MNNEFKDFIGIFPNAVPKETCEKIMEHYDYIEGLGWTTSRQGFEQARPIDKDNNYYMLNESRIHVPDPVVSDLDHNFTTQFTTAFWNCFNLYQNKYGVLQSVGKMGFIGKFKVQKNLPSEGYHVWHCEQGNIASSSRTLLVILYLNDVEEGGETEFLYQSLRVKPKQGTMIICPSGFTHTHRGNPPLSGEKYIMNTWLQFLE